MNNRFNNIKAASHCAFLLFTSLIVCPLAIASPFYLNASAGYSTMSGTDDDTGSIAGRLALGAEAYKTNPVILGLEIGAQSGINNGQLEASQEVIGRFGAPIRANLQPMADILFTVRTHSSTEQPWNVFGKLGAVVRELQLTDRSSSQDNITRVAPELVLGLGYQVTKHANIVLYYQGIYAQSDAGASLDDEGNTSIDHIPSQASGFLGVEYAL